MKILWTPKEFQTLFPGISCPPPLTGVTFDSRDVQPGYLFIGFKGPVQDGYDFVDEALHKGAAFCLVERPHPHPHTGVVQNGVESLNLLATSARTRTQATLLGITGSYGKTTAKECAFHLLKQMGPTTATQKSFNNHWGVPLTMANIFEHDRFGVIEMGMNHEGELAALTSYVRPHVSLITTIGNAHLGNFKNIDAIAKAKCEIFQSMTPGSVAVLPADNPYFDQLKSYAQKYDLRSLSFGKSAHADVRLVGLTPQEKGMTVTFALQDTILSYTLNAHGDHMAETTLGVMAALHGMGLEVSSLLPFMESFYPLKGRGYIHTLPWQSSFITIMDESYNAGPASMEAAIKAFSRMPLTKNARRWVVLGDMLELGHGAKKAHEDLLYSLLEANISGTFLHGTFMNHLNDILPASLKRGHFKDLTHLTQALCDHLQAEDAVLIKGSRGQRAFEGHLAQVIQLLHDYCHTKKYI